MTHLAEVEYAGFRYRVATNSDYGFYTATPLEGQHSAANKEKHRMAAIEKYLEESG